MDSDTHVHFFNSPSYIETECNNKFLVNLNTMRKLMMLLDIAKISVGDYFS